MAHGSFIQDLAVVLGVAAVTTVLFRWLRQPSVLGYLLTGLVVGPHVPVPLFADVERMHILSEFGVVLVMFAIGLEFRLKTLVSVLPVSGVTALVQIGALVWLGFTVGQMLGWSTTEALFLGTSIGISSTMLVSKVFESDPPPPDVRAYVLGILVLQDVAAVVLIALMTGIAAGGGLSPFELAITVLRLAGFLIALLVVGIVTIPRLVRAVVGLDSPEAIVVVAVGICFVLGVLAETFGYSVALGAFIAGILVAESGHGLRIEHAIQALKDVFVAVFFVSVGMTIDPRLAIANIGVSLLVVAVVVFGQFLSVGLGGVMSGNGLRRSLMAGLALGQIGEFAFIISSIGVSAKVVSANIQPILVTVAVITAFTTPLILGRAEDFLHFIDRRLPQRLQNLIVYYEGWFTRLHRGVSTDASAMRRAVGAIIVDAVAVVGLIIGWHLVLRPFAKAGAEHLGVSTLVADIVSLGPLVAAAAPFVVGLVKNARTTGDLVAAAALSDDPSVASRAMVRTTVGILVMLGAGAPAAAILYPLLRIPIVTVALVAGLAISAFVVWRQAAEVHAEIRSGAERVTALLAEQRGRPAEAPRSPAPVLPPDLEIVTLAQSASATGRTLGELDLRAVTGASVLSIFRAPDGLVVPTATEPLRAGDVLTLAGAPSARARAIRVLSERPDRSAHESSTRATGDPE